MNKKDELISKLINKYNSYKKKEILNLENKKDKLQTQLKRELDRFDKLLNTKKSLEREYVKYDELYYSLIDILKFRGILFDIPDKDHRVKEWDNLFIENINGLYSFTNKNGKKLYTIEKKYNDTIQHITNNYNYSVVVVRKYGNLIKAQLRIIKED